MMKGVTVKVRAGITIAIAVVLAVASHGSSAMATPDTPNWTKIGSYAPPINRFGHAMTRDVTGRTIAFGGQTTGLATINVLADTWRFNGARWIKLAPATSPPERVFAMIAYDPARKETVLFGGLGGASGTLGDTWLWDGQNWTERTPAISPPPRWSGGMAWDAATQKVILFGGAGPVGAPLGDTWSWDGTTWQREPAVVSPPPRSEFGFADGGATSKPVLFGGSSGMGQLGDTWTWDGPLHTWVPAAVTGPSVTIPASCPCGGSQQSHHRLEELRGAKTPYDLACCWWALVVSNHRPTTVRRGRTRGPSSATGSHGRPRALAVTPATPSS